MSPRAAGRRPDGVSVVQVGVSGPSPLALDRTQTSLLAPHASSPPKRISRLLLASYTTTPERRGAGGTPAGVTCVHVGVPPNPLAWGRIHTSFMVPVLSAGAHVPVYSKSAPPKMISRLLAGS